MRDVRFVFLLLVSMLGGEFSTHFAAARVITHIFGNWGHIIIYSFDVYLECFSFLVSWTVLIDILIHCLNRINIIGDRRGLLRLFAFPFVRRWSEFWFVLLVFFIWVFLQNDDVEFLFFDWLLFLRGFLPNLLYFFRSSFLLRNRISILGFRVLAAFGNGVIGDLDWFLRILWLFWCFRSFWGRFWSSRIWSGAWLLFVGIYWWSSSVWCNRRTTFGSCIRTWFSRDRLRF